MSATEIEAKFLVRNLSPLASRLLRQGGRLLVPRQHEYNLRFDDARGSLRARHHVLRLRRSDQVRLTWKGPGNENDRVRSRTELEVIVQDFDTMRQILAALGFQEIWIYEKYRAIYRWESALITLDETPIGNYLEIEEESPAAVLQRAAQLGLNPAAALPYGYYELFLRLRQQITPPPRHLTFADWQGKTCDPLAAGLRYADAT